MRHDKLLLQDLDFWHKIRWKSVLKFYEQSAPWPDPKGHRQNWRPEKTLLEIYARDETKKLDSLSILLRALLFDLSLQYLYCLSYTDQTTKKTGIATCCKPLGIVKIEMIFTTCPGN